MKAFFALIILLTSLSARAEVVLLDKDGFKFSFSGHIEADAEHDSTRSYSEIIGNRPVALPGTAAGENGRAQLSIRNSRFAFKLAAPETSGWKSLGYMEYDLLGFDGTAGTGTSENSVDSSPNPRLRHGYYQAEKNGWQITAGQTWNLLGWQPYYFLESVDVMPLPGSLYSRTAQLRGMKTIALGEKSKLEIAAAVLRPPQADSSMPDLQAGVRFSSTALQSGATGSSSGVRRLMPLSFALSGAYRQFSIPNANLTDNTHYDGYAFAADTMIPILPSRDGKTLSNTVSLFGEFTLGEGDGDQFNQWTGNSASPLSTATNTTSTANTRKPSLDAGLGDFDAGGNFSLVKLLSFNTHLQYQLPWELPDFIDIGYAQLFSNNMLNLVGTNGSTSAQSGTNTVQPYNKVEAIFANWFHDFSPSIRAGFEYVYSESVYKSAQAHNERYQVSGWFFF